MERALRKFRGGKERLGGPVGAVVVVMIAGVVEHVDHGVGNVVRSQPCGD